jgi:hypothetical protein
MLYEVIVLIQHQAAPSGQCHIHLLDDPWDVLSINYERE